MVDMKWKQILTVVMVVALIGFVVAPVQAGKTTTDSDGVRHLVVVDGAKSPTTITGNISANLTLPETAKRNYSSSFKLSSNASVKNVYMNLTISNDTISDTYTYHNASFGNGTSYTVYDSDSFWLNYTDGNYDANLTFTIDGEVHDWIKVKYEVDQTQAYIDESLSIITQIIPVVVIIAVLSIIIGMLSSLGKGGSLGGGW